MAGPAPDATLIDSSDPRALQVHRPQAARDVPYVPSDDAVVAAMLALAEVTDEDTVYDLGCGDGRIVVAAGRAGARRSGSTSTCSAS